MERLGSVPRVDITFNMDRYNRHHILKEIGIEGQESLKKSSVLIVGVGGLGSPIALYLVAAGVGRVGLIDDDNVSLSNLQRQVIYSESEVGQSKVECAKRRLNALNSETIIDTYNSRLSSDNADNIVCNYDIVIDGCDNYETRYLINDTCVKLGKPYIYGAIGEFSGQVSVFNYMGGKTYRDLYPDEEQLCSMPRATIGVIGSIPGLIGTIQATEAIKIITNCGVILSNKLYIIDMLRMNNHIISI